MKLFEKYPKLRQKAYVISIITKSVSGSMALENQPVPESRVEAIVISLLRDAELSGRAFDKEWDDNWGYLVARLKTFMWHGLHLSNKCRMRKQMRLYR